MATLPELRARAPRHHGRGKYSAYTTRIPALGSASLFVKQGTANVSLFIDGRCCRSVPRLDSRGQFFEGSPAYRRRFVTRRSDFGDGVCSMHNGCFTRCYFAVGWSVTNTWLTIALWPVRPLRPGGVAR